jgi:hypothetical protein
MHHPPQRYTALTRRAMLHRGRCRPQRLDVGLGDGVRAEISSTSPDQAIFVDRATSAGLSLYAVLLKIDRGG